MPPTMHSLAEALPAGDAPPKEMRLFRVGANTSEKGDFVFDDTAAAMVMTEAKQWGNRYCFDLDHLMLEPNPKDADVAKRALGWYDLELRKGELWAINIEFTERGAAAIRSKDLGYFSPAFAPRTDDKGVVRPARFINCALTNLPAMDRITPVASLSEELQETHSMATKAEMRADIHKAHDKMFGKAHDPAATDAMLDKMSHEEMKNCHAKLAPFHMSEIGDGNDGSGQADNPPKGDGEPDIEESKVPAKGAGQRPPVPKPGDHDADAGHEADGDDKLAVNKKHSKLASLVKELTGHESLDEAVGGLLAMSQKAGEVDTVKARLDAIERKQTTDERSALLSQAARDGKLTPDEIKGHGKMGEFIKTLSLGQLRGFVAGMSARVRTAEAGATRQGTGEEVPVTVDGQTVTLSQFDIDMAARAGLTSKEDLALYAQNKVSPWRNIAKG